MMKIKLLLLSIILTIFSCNNREKVVNKGLLSNYDFRLFQETPAWGLAKAVEDEDTVTIHEILKRKPEIGNYQSHKYGVTVLHLAVAHHKTKSVECLLNSKVNVNIRDAENGHTPLNKACLYEDINLVKLLIQYGASVNVTEVADTLETTVSPLMSACREGFIEAVELLISKGANINYAIDDLYTALSYSLLFENYKTAYFLLLNGADYSYPIIQIYKDNAREGEKTTRNVYIKEYLECQRIGYLTRERSYYYKIVDYLRSKGMEVEEKGKRNFDFATFVNELIEILEIGER